MPLQVRAVQPELVHQPGHGRSQRGAVLRLVEEIGRDLDRPLQVELPGVQRAQQPAAHQRLDPAAIGEAAIGVGQGGGARPAVGQDAAAVVRAQRRHGRRQRVGGVAVLVLGEAAGIVRLDAAEVREDQRLAVHGEARRRGAADLPVRQVPVGQVAAGVAQDQRPGDEGRRHVHPALVGEHVAWDVHPAVRQQPVRPPARQPRPVRIVPQAEEAEVIDAGFHDREIVGVPAVLQRLRVVRGQHAAMVLQAGPCLLQGRGDEDVGVKVDDPVEALAEQVQEHGRLHGRVQLHYVVPQRHVGEAGDAAGVGLQQAGGEVQAGEVLRRVHQDDEAGGVGMVVPHGLHQRRGIGDVVGGDDGEDGPARTGDGAGGRTGLLAWHRWNRNSPCRFWVVPRRKPACLLPGEGRGEGSSQDWTCRVWPKPSCHRITKRWRLSLTPALSRRRREEARAP